MVVASVEILRGFIGMGMKRGVVLVRSIHSEIAILGMAMRQSSKVRRGRLWVCGLFTFFGPNFLLGAMLALNSFCGVGGSALLCLSPPHADSGSRWHSVLTAGVGLGRLNSRSDEVTE